MVTSTVQCDFEPYHEFKLPSEVDPRKKNGKGGFLEGEIHLPSDHPKMKVTISTHPTFQFSPDKAVKYPGVEEFSPCLIYPFDKPKGQYLWDKMPIPYLQHWKLELLIDENTVFIKKNISERDQGNRTIEKVPDWEELFKIGQDQKLHLGKENNKLKVKILYPKTEARSTEGDVTVLEMLKQRGFPQKPEIAMEFCEGTNKKNLKECKLLVDIHALKGGNWELIGRGLSTTIKDSKSLLDIHYRSPNVSCSEGGSKIIMVSESSLSKDVIPEFQLWSKETGRRIEDREEEKRLLNNKIDQCDIRVQNGWLLFPTPPQPKLEDIFSKGYIFKLVAKRVSDGAVSRTFDFTYRAHDSCLYTVQEGPYSLATCNDCHFAEGDKIPEKIKAAPGKRKKRPAEDEGSQRPDDMERKNDNNSGRKLPKMMMSPDSGMGDSPPGARRESSDSTDDSPFGDILTEGSGGQVEDLEKDIPVDELIVQNKSLTADQKTSEQEELMRLLEDISDVQFDGTPKSSQATASAKEDSASTKKPKSPRPKDIQAEARQGVLQAFLNTKAKHLVVSILLFIMSMLLKLVGECVEERKVEKMFTNLISAYWPFPITFGLLCFFLYDWASDICTEQTLNIWSLIVFLALTLTAVFVRFVAALTRLINR